ncbi:LutC/YkgG family protein [Burkholderia mayonis]|uniref:LUD domain-containing protein n=1 Tax=Burkholderia mayonis TaxID=1385591 RepID=A0A1B4FX04_9BURK|nr:LUD domain-containing protein [Burkholderia mayonis]AOJ08209.1 hypothetical protein WS71_10470 [Burkholderia mayonis]KVE58909.1 hypothetical protein WS71_23865 [Burkholderia mayonis]
MSARDDILGRIRAALGSERAQLAARFPAPAQTKGGGASAGPNANAAFASDASFSAASCAARGPAISLGDVDIVTRFVAKAQQVSATCTPIATAADAPAAVDAYLRDAGLAGAPLVVAAALEALPWRMHGALPGALPGVDLRRDGLVSVTPSFAAIAETGSVMCLSSTATPTSLNFVAATHVVLVNRSAIVATIEDAWARVRASVPVLPRAVNVITGPSRTADVEQTVQVGVHGPQRVLVLICDDA